MVYHSRIKFFGCDRMEKAKISKAVIRRLPLYYRYLLELERRGDERISSQELAAALRLTASQVRQDLSRFGGFGQQGYGYNIASLRGEIGAILGIGELKGAVLIGVGNLGRALLGNFDFEGCGFRLLAAFDVDASIVGKDFHGVHVYPADTLDEFSRRYSPSIAILTMPPENAEAFAEKLAELGYSGVWNFTNRDLISEKRALVVENVHFADSLMSLRFSIK